MPGPRHPHERYRNRGNGHSGAVAGQLADLVAIDSSDTALMALPRHQLLDGLIFAATTGS
ncbi:hypothetical protein ACEWPM_017470 [Roseovarius sp. S4756]|uniref:hypothetical protein n=1 Tax=Roseovarius maritimus TaxID=3342637 RepID=UPI00372A2B90